MIKRRIVRLVLVTVVTLLGVVAGGLEVVEVGLTALPLVLAAMTFTAVGAVLVYRVPGNRVSWVMLAIAVGFAVNSLRLLAPDQSTQDLINGIGLFGLLLPGMGFFLPYWFPTGQPPSPGWRWLIWFPFLGGAVFVAASAYVAFSGEGPIGNIVNCVSPATCTTVAGFYILLLSVPLAIVSLIARWIRSTGVERLQLRWLLPAFVVFALGVLAEFGGFQGTIVANTLLPLGSIAIPFGVGFAVLRYRLYDVDRIVSRTVSYALVVGLLGLVFFGLVTSLSSRVGADNQWVVAGATLAVAALFDPLRRRVLGWVDRRFNRSRYDTQRVMDEFATSLRDETDPDRVVEGWVGVVGDTMAPSSARVWVRQ